LRPSDMRCQEVPFGNPILQKMGRVLILPFPDKPVMI
jgi:hypothetical protein